MMARPKKKTLSQNVVSVATSGMPSPVRSVLGHRIVALLVVLALPILYMLGVVSIDWQNGRPHVSVDREKAAEVKEKASERIHEIQEQRGRDQDGRPHLLSQGESSNPLGDRMAKAFDGVDEGKKPSFGFAPAANEPETPAGQKPRPGARLKKLFDDRR
jgi:hypothetical protein